MDTTAGKVYAVFELAAVVVVVPVALKGGGGADKGREGESEGGKMHFVNGVVVLSESAKRLL